MFLTKHPKDDFWGGIIFIGMFLLGMFKGLFSGNFYTFLSVIITIAILVWIGIIWYIYKK